MLRKVLLLSNFLTFDSVLEVKASERSDSDALVRETAMEENRSLLECFACPYLESLRVSQELDMLFTKSLYHFFMPYGLRLIQGLATNVLYGIVGNVQCLGDRAVGNVLVGGWSGVLAPEPEEENGSLELLLFLLSIIGKTLCFHHKFSYY